MTNATTTDTPISRDVTFPGVTLLVTHYNRSHSLERLLAAFAALGCRFEDTVVSDDGSQAVHLERLQALRETYAFRLVTTPKNKGLGNNINKGQDAVRTPYTLYIQEDFIPSEAFVPQLREALTLMDKEQGLDIARFYAYFKYPALKPYHGGFSEMAFNLLNLNHLKFYVYSDHPHLRRSNFFDKFGRYPEGLKGDVTEYRMAISFIRKKGRGLFHKDFSTIFAQNNTSHEPSTMARANWRESRHPVLLFPRRIYLFFKWLKCTWDLKFMKL